jgi:hypothetical protein
VASALGSHFSLNDLVHVYWEDQSDTNIARKKNTLKNMLIGLASSGMIQAIQNVRYLCSITLHWKKHLSPIIFHFSGPAAARERRKR